MKLKKRHATRFPDPNRKRKKRLAKKLGLPL